MSEPSTHPPASDAAEPPSLRQIAVELLAASAVVLFQELALIRWLPGQVRVLAYFPNLVLISAFLGLGLGALLAAGRSLRWLWPASLLALAAVASALSRVAFTQESSSEHLWLLYYDLPREAPVVHGVRLPILLLFVLSAVTFVPLGQIVARRLQVFRRRSSPLWGYAWDLSGSLAGVLGFALLSFLETFPVVWFTAFLMVGALFFTMPRRARWVFAVLALGVLVLVIGAEQARRYSPYYAIDYSQTGPAMRVMTNGSLHQVALPLGRSSPTRLPYEATVREGYHLPFQRLAHPPRRALVLGAGTGNDVAVLLDEGVERVDAVEIDPVILELGRKYHPDHPYDSPRVRAYNTDARSFLNDHHEPYDLIVFGTLDSMTRLSALSNVRLDNFVYTRECLQAARRHLTADGGVVLYFMVASDYIDQRLTALLIETFGEPPAVVDRHFNLFNRIYMAGPAFAGERSEPPAQAAAAATEAVELPTDDWPYLYLANRGLTPFYLSLMAAIAAIAVVGVAGVSAPMRRSLRSLRGVDLEMLLYGLAFLLLESKLVTEMSLVWGATWLTSAVVFGSILAMILISTVATELRPMPWRVAAAGLVISLGVAYALPVGLLVGRGLPLRLVLSFLYVGTPIFFAAVCFAQRFRAREAADLAFGWNLLGAVLGGLLEFSSMALGLKALSLVALVAYLAAFWIFERQRAGGATATAVAS